MSYNGWRNYETWNAALWMSNDQGTHEFWIERAEELVTEHEGDKDAAASDLAREMESECDENVPDLGASMYADILGTSLQEIDWREVAEHYKIGRAHV